MKRILTATLLGVVLCVPAPAAAVRHPRPVETPLRTIEVRVNGTVLPPSPPPRMVADHLLIPVRGIFASLGIDVERHEQRIVARAGSKTVQMTVGSARAYVDGQAVALGAPVVEQDGNTYVPLRFISDALGAQATYDAKTARVDIVSALVGKTESHGANTITGAVTAVDRNSQPATVTVTRGESVRTIAINSNAKIILQDVVARTTVAGSLNDIHPGDALTATLSRDGAVEQIVDLFASRAGTVAAVTAGSFVLANGRVITPTGSSEVTLNGAPGKIADLRPGDAVTIRSNPETGEIRQIAANRKSTGTPAPEASSAAAAPVIKSFTISATKPLRADESFEVVLSGTPGGRGTFDLGSYLSGLPLREGTPGEYRASYKVPAGANFTQIAVYGHLSVAGVDAPRAEAPTQLSVATIPPQVTDVAPPGGQTVNNSRPSIFATFATPTDIGINPSSIVLVVNGHDVTAAATRTSSFITYLPGVAYGDGTVQVTVRVADMAGNTTTRTWTFTIKTK